VPVAEAAALLEEARASARYLALQAEPAAAMRAVTRELRGHWREHYLRLPYRFVVRVREPAGTDPGLRPLRSLLARSLGLAVRYGGKGPAGSYELEAVGLGAPRRELRPARVEGEGARQTAAYLASGRIEPGARLVDGFAVPSATTSATIVDGAVRNLGEVMVLDRRRDARLAPHLAHARGLRRLPERQRSFALGDYVRRLLIREGRTHDETADSLRRWTTRFNNREILLGDVVATHAGICRHLALLFKVLADEAGLQVALVSGGLALPDRAGLHAWNEITYSGSGGRRFLVDLLHPARRGLYPAVDATALHPGLYKTRDGTPAYGSPSPDAPAPATVSVGQSGSFKVPMQTAPPPSSTSGRAPGASAGLVQ